MKKIDKLYKKVQRRFWTEVGHREKLQRDTDGTTKLDRSVEKAVIWFRKRFRF